LLDFKYISHTENLLLIFQRVLGLIRSRRMRFLGHVGSGVCYRRLRRACASPLLISGYYLSPLLSAQKISNDTSVPSRHLIHFKFQIMNEIRNGYHSSTRF
jgi:hypothetical protein